MSSLAIHGHPCFIGQLLRLLDEVAHAAHAVGDAVVHERALDALPFSDPAAHRGERVKVPARDEGETAVLAAALAHHLRVLAEHDARQDGRLQAQAAVAEATEHAILPFSRFLNVPHSLLFICHLSLGLGLGIYGSVGSVSYTFLNYNSYTEGRTVIKDWLGVLVNI